MVSSQTSKGSDTVLKTLDGFILIVNVAKDACGSIPPAQIALTSASALLTMIRVWPQVFSHCKLLVHTHLGLRDQQK